MSVEDKKLTRKERELAQRRAEILATAERVFSESGFVSARMEDIARGAEFAVGTLYKFFKSKEELYAALLQEKSELIRKRVYEELERDVSPAQRIRNVFRARVDLLWKHRDFFRLFFHGTAGMVCDPRAGFLPHIWEQYLIFLRDLDDTFRAGIELGEFRRMDAVMLTLAFEGILRAYAQRLYQTEAPERVPAEEEALLEIFMQGAQAG